MKVIDLLNKIANGEEIPKKIEWNNHIWILKYKEHSCYKYNYINEQDEIIEDWLILDCLNDEIEAIEEPEIIVKMSNKQYLKYLDWINKENK